MEPVKGMLKELDPHTNFLTPKMYEELESEAKGSFSGLGVEVTMVKDVLTVISALENSPCLESRGVVRR